MTMADEMREVTTPGDDAMGTRQMTPAMLQQVDLVRAACARAYDAIVDSTPERSREESLALTKIEEACMWAVKAISRGGK
jgi:protein-tyrosine-phosphatase